MLTAIKADGYTGSANRVRRTEGPFACPECHEPVHLKAGRIVTNHFAHYPGSTCTYGEGESERHVRMKQAVERLYGDAVRLEVPMLPDHRADAVVDLGDWAFVVECQASPLGADEMIGRTLDYNALGFPVLWLWDTGLLTEIDSKHQPHEWRVPYTIHLAHDAADWRAYIVDHADRLLAARFNDADERPGRLVGPDNDIWVDPYTPKTIRRVTFQFAGLCEPSADEGWFDDDTTGELVLGQERWKRPGASTPQGLAEEDDW